MTTPHTATAVPIWSVVAPIAALGFAGLSLALAPEGISTWLILPALPILFAAVFSAVHHAEVVALKAGQPFGSILLALAVTVIEVSLLLSAPEGESAVARDTLFAAIMIVLNGILGQCLLIGGIRHHRQTLQPHSATSALGVLATLAVLALVLPNYTLAAPGPLSSPVQLVFVAVMSLALYPCDRAHNGSARGDSPGDLRRVPDLFGDSLTP